MQSLHHKKYILVIVDDFSWFTWIFFKFKATSELIDFIKGIEFLTKFTVGSVRSDNGIKFTNVMIEKSLVYNDIDHNLSTPYTHYKMVS